MEVRTRWTKNNTLTLLNWCSYPILISFEYNKIYGHLVCFCMAVIKKSAFNMFELPLQCVAVLKLEWFKSVWTFDYDWFTWLSNHCCDSMQLIWNILLVIPSLFMQYEKILMILVRIAWSWKCKSSIFSISYENKQEVTNLSFSRYVLSNSNNISLFCSRKDKNKKIIIQVCASNSHANSMLVLETELCELLHDYAQSKDAHISFTICMMLNPISMHTPLHTALSTPAIWYNFSNHTAKQNAFKSPVWYGNILLAL